MRLLVDEHALAWDRGLDDHARGGLSYTNHTLMPEALETWPVALLQRAAAAPPGDHLRHQPPASSSGRGAAFARRRCDLLRRLSLIDEHGERRVRMAHLSIVGSHKVNGVSALHSDLMVKTIFADFARAVARALHQHHQRRHAAALAGAGQPGPGRRCSTPSIGSGWRARPRPAGRTARHWPATRHFGQALQARQARQQGAPGRAASRRELGLRDRPRQPVRRAGQAHPRVQAPAAQPAARGDALPGHRSPTRQPTGCRARSIFAGKAASCLSRRPSTSSG